ncbi:HlyD family type I secretion periplasmic adaptor subunit [Methylocaldum gracile]|uniref:HlyD family type I secretion periplasmic adaptor subunit n=1 Tax=unclassified Methylocaldum TaxID=2622260 RepID=UPI0010DD03E5
MIRLHAATDLIRRYGRVFRQAWAERQRLDPPQRLPHEAEFLPAALALQETPVSPAPRVLMWLIMTFAATALLWSIIGQVDMVASAEGKIIPNDRTKIIQPMETAKVTAIHVRDGQSVKAGEVLIELDPTMAQADIDRIANDLLTARLDAARAKALLEAIASDRLTPVQIEGLDATRLAAERRLLEGQYLEYRAKLKQLEAEIVRRTAEERATRELVRKLEQTLPITRERAEDYRGLRDKNFVSKHAYLELEQARIEQERDLAAQQAKLAEIHAALAESRQQREALIAETRRLTLDKLHDAEQQAATQAQELIKAESRGRFMTLTAPVDGAVQQLAVHTVGGVVTPAQPLLVIVPRDNPLEVEAFLQNKDIGFVNAGQEAEVKIETFPFTKYGTIPAQVIQVSNDAIQDEKRGLIYAARVALSRATMLVEEKTVNLTPGMAVTVEIKTGKRRLIEYFLSPLLQYKDESLRER